MMKVHVPKIMFVNFDIPNFIGLGGLRKFS